MADPTSTGTSDEELPEVQCPACGATIRSRLGDQVVIAELRAQGWRSPAELAAAELNRRRIQGGMVVLRGQLTCAAVHALRGAGLEGDSVTAAVALVAMERLLEDLGIPVRDGVLSRCVSKCGSPAGGELTSE